ncbi:MAG: glycolate oxidase subunit GlcF [Parvularculaceae bacterium]
MQTNFTEAQLKDPQTAYSESVLRRCVHCGFCTATCPTYQLLGDELDSPRGRIYLIQRMLEEDAPPSAKTVTHLDRCLSCLACVTTCPSGVDYMRLIDHARAHIEETYARPPADRAFRALLATVLPNPLLFRLSLRCAALARPFRRAFSGRLRALLDAAPSRLPSPAAGGDATTLAGGSRKRVALLTGCVQPTLAPEINAATIRLLTKVGCAVVVAPAASCCGALVHHLGREEAARETARRNVAAWSAEVDKGGLDALIVNASGCGTMVKDYGTLLADDAAYKDRAARIAAIAKDVVEFLDEEDIAFETPQRGRVAYQSACSMQHGQGIRLTPQKLLRRAGFDVVEPAESHLCCGSAGAYSFLQPEIAGRLRDRKAGHLSALKADIVASGNIGCITHLRGAVEAEILHTVQLLDWAHGGPDPRRRRGSDASAENVSEAKGDSQ